MRTQIVAEILARHVERSAAARREQEQLRCCVTTPVQRSRWRLLEDNVGVGAAGAEARDAGDPRFPGCYQPRPQAGVDKEWRVGEVSLRIRRLVVKRWRQLTVLEGTDRLDQAAHARGLARVADVGFDRADGA